jgi:hypothetical protein
LAHKQYKPQRFIEFFYIDIDSLHV